MAEDAVDKLFAVFADPQWPVDDLRHFLPWVLVNMPVDFDALDDATVAIFAQTVAKAGVGEDDDVKEKLALYYDEYPPNPDLVAALQAAWRDVNASSSGPNPFAKFAGSSSSSSTNVLDSGARPAGTIRAGPMARFQDLKKKDPKDPK